MQPEVPIVNKWMAEAFVSDATSYLICSTTLEIEEDDPKLVS